MGRLLTILISLAFALQNSAGLPQADLPSLLAGVERTFARMRDLTASFVQIYEDPLNRKYQESGHLYLKRPRMMRWEYRKPEEKLFVSNGKMVYLYTPADRQVNREAVKESLDDRIPLMLLLGNSNLRKEFARIELIQIKPLLEGNRVLRMFPRRAGEINEIILEVDPSSNYLIRRLIFSQSDGSRSEFIFSNIRTNSGLDASFFDFKIPPGVQVLEGIGQ